MRRRARGAVACVAMALLAGCGPTSPDGTDPAPRTYAMGFAPNPPQATSESVVETAQRIAAVAEITIIHQEVPWAALLDGTQTIEQALDELAGLADFLRALGLDLIYLLDPLDGLDRRREPYDLLARGRSITEPEIRAMHDAWALAVAERLRPAWFGLASEINTLADAGDPDLYAAVRAMINELAPQVGAASPETRTFVSFQVDQAYGLAGFPRTIDHFALIDDFDVDGLGLSTYPGFLVDDPSAIPADYFRRFDEATDRPLLLVEGGWSSADTPLTSGTPAEQADFLRRIAGLLNGVNALTWISLTYADLDLSTFGLPPDREAALANFAHMGIVESDFDPKPAAAVWDSVRARPLD